MIDTKDSMIISLNADISGCNSWVSSLCSVLEQRLPAPDDPDLLPQPTGFSTVKDFSSLILFAGSYGFAATELINTPNIKTM